MFTEKEHQEVLRSIRMTEMPREFTQVILEQNQNGPSAAPVVVAEFPEMTPDEFRAWMAAKSTVESGIRALVAEKVEEVSK